VVEFASIEGEPVDIRVNKILIARGEVIVEKEKYGVRIIETVG
jgi:flagellar motor switch/type III secretory pathway protein FliN